MIEKVKNFFAAMASTAVLLYAVGYMAEYSHARMLGISLVDPFRESYLMAGGTFILSTLYALYSTIFSYFLYLVPFVVLIAVFLLYEAADPPKGISKLYAAGVSLLTVVFLFVAIPVFTSPFGFRDLLMTDARAETGFLFKHFNYITSELRTWIVNGGLVNRQKLVFFYVLSISSAVVSVVMLYSMVRRWKRWKRVERESPAAESVFWLRYLVERLLKRVPGLPRYGFGLLVILVMVAAVVQVVSIPVNYGMLVKSNDYPVVNVTVQKEGFELVENRAPGTECKLLLLREDEDEILLYAAFYPKGSETQKYKLLTLKKGLVEKIEISGNGFIFEYK